MRTDKLSTSTVVKYARINNSRTSKSRVCCYCQKWNVLISQLELTRLFPSLLTFMHVVLFHTWNWCVTWDNFGSFLLLQLTFFPLHFPDYSPPPPLFVYALENGYMAAAPGWVMRHLSFGYRGPYQLQRLSHSLPIHSLLHFYYVIRPGDLLIEQFLR